MEATDLRAAAALILVGLRANGITRVSNLKYLDRGYYEFHKNFKKARTLNVSMMKKLKKNKQRQ